VRTGRPSFRLSILSEVERRERAVEAALRIEEGDR